MSFRFFVKNTFTYAVGNVGLRAVAFLLIPIYTHVLSLADFGLLSILMITTQVLMIVINAGSRTAFIRFAREDDDRGALGRLFGSTVLVHLLNGLVVTAAALAAGLPLMRLATGHPALLPHIMLVCVISLFQALFIHMMAYYRIRERGRIYVAASLASALVLIVLTLAFVRFMPDKLLAILVAQVITYCAGSLIVFLHVRRSIGASVDGPTLQRVYRFGWPLVFSMSSGLIADASSAYFLGLYAGMEAVGMYNLGLKIAQIAIITLVLPFQLTYEPYVYANLQRHDIRRLIARIMIYLVLGFTLVALGIAYSSRGLLGLVAPHEYFGAHPIIFLLLPGLAFRGLYYIGESLINIRGRTHLIGLIGAVYAAATVALNALLIARYKLWGAVALFNLTNAALTIAVIAVGHRFYPIPIELRRALIAGGTMVLLLYVTWRMSSAGALLYYAAIPLMVIAVQILYYKLNFYQVDEKAYIQRMLGKWRWQF